MKRLVNIVVIAFALSAGLAHAVDGKGAILLTSYDDPNARFAIGAIKLALQKMNVELEVDVTIERWSELRKWVAMDEGKQHVMWNASNRTLEERFIPIRIPLYKGLLGHRIAIIHKNNRDIFANVRTMDDVKKFSFGQGYGWADTDILRANGLNVIATPKYEGLFHMTDGGRFDAFPRGVQEPWSEIKSRPDLELMVDEHIMLVYRMPFYLFVTKHRPKLAEVIKEGLYAAIMDGTYDRYLLGSETVQMVIKRAKLEKRRIFYLDNPDLTAETPLDREELWIDIDKLVKMNNEYQLSLQSLPSSSE